MKRKVNLTLIVLFMVTFFAMGFAFTGLITKAEDAQNWTDGLSYDADFTYGGGTGTAADPYRITQPTHLAQLAVNQNYDQGITSNYSQGKYFKLMNNIDVSGKNWTPIGNKIGIDRNNAFYGGFDFNGYKVSGISHTGYDGQFYGFFGAFSVGYVKNPRISYDNVNVNYTGGAGSVVCDSEVTTVASFGGVTGVMIGGLIGFDDDTAMTIDVDYNGAVSFTNTVTDTRGYHGGVVGFLIGGTIGNGGVNGSVDISVEINENASLSFINNTGELIYVGGIVGNGYAQGIVGNSNSSANGDVNISFTNNNKSLVNAGLYAESNGTGRCGLIAGEANFDMGSVGSGASNVNIIATNNGLIHYLFTKTQLNYCGGLFGGASGLKGTKGMGNVTIKLDNYGLLKLENNASEEIRFGGISAYTSGDSQTVFGIDNATSNGNVYIACLNHGDAKINRADNWAYYTAMQFGYMTNTLVGTKGTGDVSYVSQTKLENFFNINGPLKYPFINEKDASCLLGSLNGGSSVEQTKTFGYFLTDLEPSSYGYINSWEQNIVITDLLTESDNVLWEIIGANSTGVIYGLNIASGYGFDSYDDETQVEVDENGMIYSQITSSKALPSVNTVQLSSLEVDFSAVDYTGETLQPSLTNYTVIALDENGNGLNAVMPKNYDVFGVKLYKGNLLIGTLTYEQAKKFTINKLNNDQTVDVTKFIIDANTETYSLSANYEVAKDEVFNEKMANSGSLSELKGEQVYVRIKETATYKASAVATINLDAYTVSFEENEGVDVDCENKTSFLKGAIFEFTITIKDGYRDDNLVVKSNNEPLTGSDGEYFVLVNENTTIKIEGVKKIVLYNVTLPSVDFATVKPVTVGQDEVEKGDSFMFTVESEKDITVKVNGTEIKAVSGVYTVANVEEDITIEIIEVKVAPVEPGNTDTPSTPTDTPNDKTDDAKEDKGCLSSINGANVILLLCVVVVVLLCKRKAIK